MLPKDPLLLLSVTNTQLRDRYDSLDALCDDLDACAETICCCLGEIGYCYCEKQNRFICKEES